MGDTWKPVDEIATGELLSEIQRRHPRGCVFIGIREAAANEESAFLTYENRFAARDLCRLALQVIREPGADEDEECVE